MREAHIDTRHGEILIIDDEPVIRRIMGRVLAGEAAVVIPETAEEALAMIRDGRRFDAIVCDMMMPDLTGIELHEQIAALDPDQARRIVFVSGGTFDPHATGFLASIDNPQLEKPFRPDELRMLVGNIIASLGHVAR